MFENQFLPTLKDINSKEVRNLGQRLKGKSNKETLTTLLEWENRNIQMWVGRFYMFILLYPLLIFSFVLLPLPWTLKGIVIAILFVFAFWDSASAISYSIPLIIFIIILFGRTVTGKD